MTLKEIEVEVTETTKIHVCNNCGSEADWHAFSDELAFCMECAEHQFGIDISITPYFVREKGAHKYWYKVDLESVYNVKSWSLASIILTWFLIIAGFFWLGYSPWYLWAFAFSMIHVLFMYFTRNWAEYTIPPKENLIELTKD